MVDAKAERVQVSISNEDFEIRQSPGVLQSKREGGTTGAVVWQASVRLAEWFAWPKNFLRPFLSEADSSVIELGSGISGLVPLALHSHVRKVIATDQTYLLKALLENINDNLPNSSRPSKQQMGRYRRGPKLHTITSNIEVVPLDWEEDDKSSFLKANDLEVGVDAIVACDCIYNYALIDPLVQTCLEICQYRKAQVEPGSSSSRPTVCIFCQQLRQPDVFSQWLETFHKSFRVWRVPDELLTDALRENSGFAVHVGVLRD